jgi:omega-6 fatty acid desaturase (delta-12 desaturase)
LLLSPSAPSLAALQPRRAEAAPTGPAQPRDWLKRLATYREPQLGRGLVELAVTLVPYLGLWLLVWLSLGHGYWLSLLLAVPAAGFLVRLFMIQHDCGHGSFFPRRRGNDWLGRVLGVLTLTPYGYWRRTHAVHHATSGNLDQRGMGDITTLTVREFQSLTPARRVLYRLSRNPLVLLGLGPVYLFVLKHRLPVGLMRSGKDAWLSVMGTNLAIAAMVAALAGVLGLGDFLLVQAPITLLASSLGIWLFYVQHQFEHTYWEPDEQWSVHAGAMQGSSHYDLPPVLRWFTANIGIHHVHHLCSRIPSYRLGEVLRAHPELRGINRLTLRQSLRCFRFALWDEERRTMVGFREAAAAAGT